MNSKDDRPVDPGQADLAVPRYDMSGARGAQIGDNNVQYNQWNGLGIGGDVAIDLGPEGEIIDLGPGAKVALDVRLANRTQQRQNLRLKVEKPALGWYCIPHPASPEATEGHCSADGVITIHPAGRLKVRFLVEAAAAEPAAGEHALHVCAVSIESPYNILGWNHARRVKVSENRVISLRRGPYRFVAVESSFEVCRVEILAENAGNTQEVIRIAAEYDRSAGEEHILGHHGRWVDPRWATFEVAQATFSPCDRSDVVVMLRLPRRAIRGRSWLATLAAVSTRDSVVIGRTTEPVTIHQDGRLEGSVAILTAAGRRFLATMRFAVGRALSGLHQVLKRRTTVPWYAIVTTAFIVTLLAMLVLATTSARAPSNNGEPGKHQPNALPAGSTTLEPAIGRTREFPPIIPAGCIPGRWITQLASTSVDSRGLQDTLDRIVALRSRTSKALELKVTRSDDACETLAGARNYYVIYMGPYDSSDEAIAVCNSFGWRTHDFYDRNQCFAHALDPNVPGGPTLWPDGTRPTHS